MDNVLEFLFVFVETIHNNPTSPKTQQQYNMDIKDAPPTGAGAGVCPTAADPISPTPAGAGGAGAPAAGTTAASPNAALTAVGRVTRFLRNV